MCRSIIRIAALLSAAISIVPSALAADLPVRVAPPIAAPAVFSWTGIYIGGHGGYGWGHKDWTEAGVPPVAAGSHRVRGPLAGGQIGANYQTGPWVLGLEGQFSWTDLKGSHVNPADIADTLTTNVRWIGNVAGRVGYAFDRTLVYARGGGAWTRDEHTKIDLGLVEGSGRLTRTGWLAGAGIEQALFGNWSAKVEYNFMHFGTKRLTMADVGGAAPDLFDIRQEVHAVTFGLNYRFGWDAPLVARY